jgi:hypothetical protein
MSGIGEEFAMIGVQCTMEKGMYDVKAAEKT